MEQKKLQVPLMGITHSTSDNMCKDGEQSELINLRHKDGSLQPIFDLNTVFNDPSWTGHDYDTFLKVFIHRHGTYVNWLGINTHGVYWFAAGEAPVVKSPPTTITAIVPLNIEQIGNIVIITNADGIFYLFFKDGAYVPLSQLELFPEIKFEAVARAANENPTCEYEDDYLGASGIDYHILRGERINTHTTDEITNGWNIGLANDLKSLAARAQATADDNGWLHGARYVRYAVKLYDGNYILHSAPILIIPPRGVVDEEFIMPTEVPDNNYFVHFLSLYKLYASWGALAGLTDLKGIISSVDIFISQMIDRNDYDAMFVYLMYLGYETLPSGIVDDTHFTTNPYRYYERPTFADDLKDCDLFYKIKSLTVDEIIAGGTDVLLDTKETRDILPTKEALPDDDFTHNMLIPQATFVYNSKLHLGDITTELFEGFSPSFFGLHDKNLSWRIRLETTIRTSEGIKKVFSDVIEASTNIGFFTPMISYPDARAESIIIHYYGSGNHYTRTFSLTKHKTLNLAYYLDPTYTKIDIEDTDEMSAGVAAPGNYLELLLTNAGDGAKLETNPQKIKVSKVLNPFYFAAENTYEADAQIVGFASVNEALSEGTAFGMNPLYIFTKGGIELMEVGTGEVYYTRITKGPRDVCINKKGILPLERGIVFPSVKGLMMISGVTTVCLSENLNGSWADELLTDARVKMAAGDASETRFTDVYEQLTAYRFEEFFAKFLVSCEIGYNHLEDEIILVGGSPATPSIPVCFVLDVKALLWHKATYDIKSFIPSYPQLYCMPAAGLTIKDFSTPVAPLDAFFITRPIKFNSTAFKRVSRMILRGEIRYGSMSGTTPTIFPYTDAIQGSTNYSRLMLYGSNDCERWYFMGGIDKQGSVHDLGANIFRYSYKYFRVVYAGKPFYGSRFDFLEFDVEERFNKKAR